MSDTHAGELTPRSPLTVEIMLTQYYSMSLILLYTIARRDVRNKK